MTADIIQLDAYRPSDDQPGRVPELEFERPLFVDYLTIRQFHEGGGLPIVSDGFSTRVDAEGELRWQTVCNAECEGSFDSRMFIMSDGSTCLFHGNIARWERPDNVFGYRWDETIDRINRLMARHFLPPFTPGDCLRYADSGWVWTGARVSRIDLTVNYWSGSEYNAQAVLYQLARHHAGRQLGSVMPDQATVTYGYGSKYASQKVYLKAVELAKHKKKKHGQHVDLEVIQWCKDVGMLREEITLKSRFLTQNGLCYLGQITELELNRVYRARSQIRKLPEYQVSETKELTSAAAGTLSRWEKGEPFQLKKATYYRHRREILDKTGIDISVQRSVVQLSPPVKVIEIQPLVAPDWYRKKYG